MPFVLTRPLCLAFSPQNENVIAEVQEHLLFPSPSAFGFCLKLFLKQKKEFSFYSVFQGFSEARFAYGGSILSSSQFLILFQLPQKMKLKSKVVKIDPKIIVSLPKI